MIKKIRHSIKSLVKILSLIFLSVVLGKVFPVPVFYSDFMTLYHALLGWSKGASFYDYSLQLQLSLVTVPNGSLQVYPYFPYPPWYAGATFFLAWLSYEWAYRTWMILNIGMLVFSAHLLNINQPKRIRFWRG